MSDKNEEQFEADALIDSLYKDHAGEQPPASLDNLILAKARGQTREAPAYRKPRWHVPVVLCMVPAIALAVVLKLGNFGRGGDMSAFEGADSSNVYATEEFVLHIPRASDAIVRPQKPDFSSESMASSDIENLTAKSQSRARAAVAGNATAEIVANAEAEINIPVAPPEVAAASSIQLAMHEESLPPPTPDMPPVDPAPVPDGVVIAAQPAPIDMDDVVASAPTPAPIEMGEVVTAAPPAAAPAPVEMADVVASAPAVAMEAPADMVAMSKAPPEVSTAMQRQVAEKILVSREDDYLECPPREERGEMCPDVYQPVCGERDTGVRCMVAPCSEATEMKTYSNACYACADLDVYGYFAAGACEDLVIENSE